MTNSFFHRRFPSRQMLLSALAAAALLFGASEYASAQKVIYEGNTVCDACLQFGERCCARRSSVADCIKCGARYDLAVQTAWCQKNQPVCSAKRKSR